MGPGIWLYLWLLSRGWAAQNDGHLLYCHEEAAQELGVTSRTIKNWFQILEDHGYVVILARHPYNLEVQITNWKNAKDWLSDRTVKFGSAQKEIPMPKFSIPANASISTRREMALQIASHVRSRANYLQQEGVKSPLLAAAQETIELCDPNFLNGHELLSWVAKMRAPRARRRRKNANQSGNPDIVTINVFDLYARHARALVGDPEWRMPPDSWWVDTYGVTEQDIYRYRLTLGDMEGIMFEPVDAAFCYDSPMVVSCRSNEDDRTEDPDTEDSDEAKALTEHAAAVVSRFEETVKEAVEWMSFSSKMMETAMSGVNEIKTLLQGIQQQSKVS
jgi:hypothetical protein